MNGSHINKLLPLLVTLPFAWETVTVPVAMVRDNSPTHVLVDFSWVANDLGHALGGLFKANANSSEFLVFDGAFETVFMRSVDFPALPDDAFFDFQPFPTLFVPPAFGTIHITGKRAFRYEFTCAPV
jgi:hypothetical protein